MKIKKWRRSSSVRKTKKKQSDFFSFSCMTTKFTLPIARLQERWFPKFGRISIDIRGDMTHFVPSHVVVNVLRKPPERLVILKSQLCWFIKVNKKIFFNVLIFMTTFFAINLFLSTSRPIVSIMIKRKYCYFVQGVFQTQQ